MINLILCGTPGTGKSTLINKLKQDQKLLADIKFINLSAWALAKGCTSGYDDKLGCHIIDEDKLNEEIEKDLIGSQKVNLIESIHSDMLEPSLIDAVFVCRTNNTELYDRLKARDYDEDKISNNLQAEIFQVVLDEAREKFNDESLLFELKNDNFDDLERNVRIIKDKLYGLIESTRI